MVVAIGQRLRSAVIIKRKRRGLHDFLLFFRCTSEFSCREVIADVVKRRKNATQQTNPARVRSNRNRLICLAKNLCRQRSECVAGDGLQIESATTSHQENIASRKRWLPTIRKERCLTISCGLRNSFHANAVGIHRRHKKRRQELLTLHPSIPIRR